MTKPARCTCLETEMPDADAETRAIRLPGHKGCDG